jgi:hypothetical protein
MNVATKTVGRKDDTGKVRADLLPANALMEVAKVLTFGAQKYGAENTWQNVTPFRARYTAALMRHLFARQRGELYDPESGLLHMAHLACCALFLLSGEVGHDTEERLPAPPPVPSRAGVERMLAGLEAIQQVTITTEMDAEPHSDTIPSSPLARPPLWHPPGRHMTSIPITGTNPDADPPPSDQDSPIPYVVADPFPSRIAVAEDMAPDTLKSGPVVEVKEYHVLHLRCGQLVEEARVEDAAAAWTTMTAYETFAQKGDHITVIKLGVLLYSNLVGK